MEAAGFGLGKNNFEIRRAFARDDFEYILKFYDSGEFFNDCPTPLLYKLINNKYGQGARFILTLRSSPSSWYESLCRHNEYSAVWGHKHHHFFNYSFPFGRREEHIRQYENHLRDVVAFFEGVGARDRLLVLNVEKEESIQELEAFIGKSTGLQGFPKANRGGKKLSPRRFARRIWNIPIHLIYASLAPRFFPAFEELPVVSPPCPGSSTKPPFERI